MTKDGKLLYIAPSASSFIKQDVKHLKKHYNVIFLTDEWANKKKLFFCFVRQLISLVKHLRTTDKIICSFAGYSSFLPSLLGRITKTKVGIIINGTDAISLPNYNYGLLRKKLPKWFVKKSYQWASVLLPVSESLIYSESNFCPLSSPLKVGVKHFFQDIKFKHKVIPNGFDTDFWTIGNIKKEKNSFVAVMSSSQFELKGGDLIVNTAGKIPKAKFYFAGMQRPTNLTIPKNVTFLGKLSPDLLKQKFQTTQFVLQLSVFEGFGCSLCEAMLCGCIPIVSSVNELPTIVGNDALVIDAKNPSQLQDKINYCLENNKMILQNSFANRITENYSIEKRINLLRTF